jgi:stage V sporulation protein B
LSDARLKRDVIWNLVPVVLLAVVGLGLNFVIGGWWGPAALGVFNQVTTAFFVVSVFGAGGLQYSVLRAVAEVADDRGKTAAVVLGALVPTIGIAAVSTLAFVLLAPAIGELLDSSEVATGMRWAAPGLFCFAVNKVLLGVVNGLRRMRAFAVYQSLRYIGIALGLGVAALVGATAGQLPLLWTVTEGALFLVLVVELVMTVSLTKCAGWVPWVKKHLDFGIRGVVSTLAFELNSKLDLWLLGIVMSDERVGIYSLASALAEGVIQLAVVVQNNINPTIARAIAAGRLDEVHALVASTRRWFVPGLAAICAISAVCFPFVIPFVIRDASFADGAPSFAILVGGIALTAPWQVFNSILLMASRPGWNTILVLLVVSMNFVGNVLLIPRMGMEGAATATAVTSVLSVFLLVRIARTRAGVRL